MAAQDIMGKIQEDQVDLTKTHAAIHDLRNKILSLVIFNQIPDKRLVDLRYRWIVGFLKGRNREWRISPDMMITHEDSSGFHVSHQPPSGVFSVPTFTVMHDLHPDDEEPSADDPELFIASRIETVACVSQICNKGVVDTIKLIEGSASPLEQLARQAG